MSNHMSSHMSGNAPQPMSPEEIRAYRAGVEALIAACLAQIRGYPLGRDADPARERQS